MTKLKKSSTKRPSYVCSPGFAIRKARRGQKLNKWELEKIAADPTHATRYAMEVLKGRFIMAEELISQNAMCASQYAINVMRGRWEQAEPAISQCASSSIEYATMLGQRFSEGEDAMLKMDEITQPVRYAVKVVKNRWPELERKILNFKCRWGWARKSFYLEVNTYLTKVVGGRWLEWEQKLLHENRIFPIYQYALFLGGKLPEALHQKMVLQGFDTKKSKFAKKYLRFLEKTENKLVQFFRSLAPEEREELFEKIKS